MCVVTEGWANNVHTWMAREGDERKRRGKKDVKGVKGREFPSGAQPWGHTDFNDTRNKRCPKTNLAHPLSPASFSLRSPCTVKREYAGQEWSSTEKRAAVTWTDGKGRGVGL